MTTFTIEVPEETVTALCRAYGYKEGENGTPEEFAQERIAAYLKEIAVADDYQQKVKAVVRMEEPAVIVRASLTEEQVNEIKARIYDLSEEINQLAGEQQLRLLEIQELKERLEESKKE